MSNKTVEGDNAVVTSYTYDNQNRLTQSVTGNATTYYGYDNNGNQISEWTRIANSDVVSSGVQLGLQSEATDALLTLYVYDVFDRLIKIEQGADVIENAYTADGKKLSRTTNGKITYYVYDGNVVIEEQRSNNSESARNVYGRNLITREASSDKYVYGYNGHGDVVYLTDTNGIVEITYDYDEFGNIISEEVVETSVSTLAPTMIDKVESAEENVEIIKTVINNPYRYAGYEYIEEVKLYDLSARYYNPEIARFISADPYYNLGNRVIGLYEINVPTAASIIYANNVYVYCGNNSIKYIDRSGYIPVETIIDVASIGWSFNDFVSNPSWANFGFLLWDVASAIIPYAPGSYTAKGIKAGTKLLSKADDYKKAGVWAMKAVDRGYEIEKSLGGMANNFPTIDKYVSKLKNGINMISSATSIKSIDITASSYQKSSKLKSKLKGYVDDLAEFSSTSYKGKVYEMETTAKRILEVAVPPVEMTSSQAKVFQEVTEYAAENGIELIVKIVE